MYGGGIDEKIGIKAIGSKALPPQNFPFIYLLIYSLV
jgi:hypothetical protein